MSLIPGIEEASTTFIGFISADGVAGVVAFAFAGVAGVAGVDTVGAVAVAEAECRCSRGDTGGEVAFADADDVEEGGNGMDGGGPRGDRAPEGV